MFSSSSLCLQSDALQYILAKSAVLPDDMHFDLDTYLQAF